MSSFNWDDGEMIYPTSAGSDFDWDQGQMIYPNKDKSQSFTEDMVKSLKAGAEEVPSIAAHVADIVPGILGMNYPVSKLTDEIGQETGFQPKKWAQENLQSRSDELQRQQAENKAAWDRYEQGKGTLMDAINTELGNGRSLAAMGAESVPSMIAGGAAGRALIGLGAVSSPIVAGAAGEGLVSAGQTMSQLEGQADPQKAALASAVSGTIVGVISKYSGGLAHRLGLNDIDTLLAGGKRETVQEGSKAFSSRIGHFMGAAAEEGLMEELPQSAVEQMAQNYAQGTPLMQGVAQQMFEGAAVGAAMGGGASMVGRNAAHAPAPEVTPQADTNQTQINPITHPIVEQDDAQAQQQQQPKSVEDYMAQVSQAANDALNPNNQPAFDPDFDPDAVPQIAQIKPGDNGYVQIPENAVSGSSDVTLPLYPKGEARADIQTDGSQNRTDAGTDQSVLGLPREQQTDSGKPAESQRVGGVDDTGTVRSNDAGKGTDATPLTATEISQAQIQQEGIRALQNLTNQQTAQVNAQQEANTAQQNAQQSLQAVAMAPVPPTQPGHVTAPQYQHQTPNFNQQQNPTPNPTPQAPLQYDPRAFASTPVQPQKPGMLVGALESARNTKGNIDNKGLFGAIREGGAAFIQKYVDRDYGFTRYADMNGLGWTTVDANGNRQATPRAKAQGRSYGFQLSSQSLIRGGLDFNKEGMPYVTDNEANIPEMVKTLEAVDTGGVNKDEFANGFMQNLTYFEREQQLQQQKANAQQEIGAINVALQTERDTRKIAALENRKSELKPTLGKTIERPASVTDYTIQQALLGLQQDQNLQRLVALNKMFNDTNIAFAQKAGIISPETAQAWQQNQFYSPLQRVMEEENPDISRMGGRSNNPAIKEVSKKFRGSQRNVQNYLDNLMFQRVMLGDVGINNDAVKSMLQYLQSTGQAGVQSYGTTNPQKKGGPETIAVKENGVKTYYTVEDPLAYRALLRAEHELPGFLKVMEKITHGFRNAIMLMPDAMFRNAMRDVAETWMYNYTDKSLGGVYVDVARRIANRNAGLHTPGVPSVIDYGITGHREEANFEREFRTFYRRNMANRNSSDWSHNTLAAIDAAMQAAFHRAEDISMRVELGPRSHIFDQVMKRTGSTTEAQMAALNQLDFRRRGDGAAITFLKAAVPFVNSSIQGIYKIWRALAMNDNLGMNKESARQALMMKGMQVAAVASVYTFLMARGGDDDDNQFLQASKRLRDTNILARVPGMAKGQYMKLPLPFELGSMFWSIPSNVTLNMMGKQNGADFKEAIGTLLNNMIPNLIPQAVKPIIEVGSNHDYFTDNPIVPASMEKLIPELQARPTTSHLARGISSVTPLNPLQADHLINGWFGSVGGAISGITDAVMERSDKNAVDKPWYKQPVVKSLFTDPMASENKNRLYKLRDDSVTITQSANKLMERFDKPGLDKLLAGSTHGVSNRKLYAANDLLNGAAVQLSEMRKAYDAVRNNPNMDSAQRREQIEKYQMIEKRWLQQFVPPLRAKLQEELEPTVKR